MNSAKGGMENKLKKTEADFTFYITELPTTLSCSSYHSISEWNKCKAMLESDIGF